MSEFRNLMSSKVMDMIVRVAVIVSVLVSGFAAWRWQDLTTCVAEYNDINNQRLVALAEVTEIERRAEETADKAQAALFTNPILNKPSAQRSPKERDQVLTLFVDYQRALNEQTQKRKETDVARKEHPIPDPPKDVCG